MKMTVMMLKKQINSSYQRSWLEEFISFLCRAGRNDLLGGDSFTLGKICEKIQSSLKVSYHCLHQLMPAKYLHKFNLRKRDMH